MNVLLLAEVAPPEPIVGAFRVGKLIDALSNDGHTVTAVVSRAGGQQSSVQGNHLLRVAGEFRSPVEILRARSAPAPSLSSARPQLAEVDPSRPQGERSRGSLWRFATAMLHLPDDRQGVIIPLVLEAMAAHRNRPFDLIYSTAPAFSVQLAAYCVAKFTGRPWIAEFRDPWRGNGGDRPVQRNGFVDSLDEWLENKCIMRANAIVMVSESAASSIRDRYKNKPVATVLNGIDSLATRRATARSGPIRMVYAGSLYSPRDPRPLLKAVVAEASAMGVDVELHFAGHCGEYEGETIEMYLRRIGFAGQFAYTEWMPKGDSQQLMASADLLLLPAQRWVEQVPNKLFDYLGARVPILALVEPNSETLGILGRVGGHFVCGIGDTERQISNTVRNALSDCRNTTLVGSGGPLEELLVSQQFARLPEIIRSVSQSQGNNVR